MGRRLDETERKVVRYIRLHGLFAGAARILVAVSGGTDSIALLHILHAVRVEELMNVSLLCAHVNHRLRGSDADADERFVCEEARAIRVPAVVRSADVRAYAGAHHLSLETAGRQVRLAALADIAREQGCTWIATGHQQNDNAETLVHRLLRGTGFRGLAGIPPARPLEGELRLARPLLCLARDETARYLEKHRLSWREDRTNIDVAHTRNSIRHLLLPALQQEAQSSLVEELSELAASARALYNRIDRKVERLWPRLTRTAGSRIALEAAGLGSSPDLVAIELIRRALTASGCGERNLTRRHYRDILQLARAPAQRKNVSLPQGFSVGRKSDWLVISARTRAPRSPLSICAAAVHVPGETAFCQHRIHAEVLPRSEIPARGLKDMHDQHSEWLDLDRIRPPITVRPRHHGDHFEPLGQSNEMKIGKFLTAAKVPADVRERALIFADREKILWVCPVRISERVKVTKSTRQVLHLSVTRPRQPQEPEV